MTASELRISGIGEMIALLPHHLGYHPRRSLVLLCVHRVAARDGGTLRLGLVARMDLPAEGEEGPVLDQALETVARESPYVVSLVACEEEDDDASLLLRRLGRGCADLGIDVAHEARVRDGRYLLLRTPSGGPAHWHDVPPLADVPAALTYVLRGEVPLADREALERLVTPDPDLVDPSVEAMYFQRLDRSSPGGATEPRTRATALWYRVLAEPDDPREPLELAPEELAELLVSLLDIGFRDCLLAVLAPRPFRVSSLADDVLDGLAAELRDAVDDGPGLVDRLAAVVRCTPPALAAPVLTLLGVVCWARGDGTLANIAVDRALATTPRYRLAMLLDTALSQGLSPHGRSGADGSREGAA